MTQSQKSQATNVAKQESVNSADQAIRQLGGRAHLMTSLQLLVDSHALVSIVDTDQRYIYVNDTFCRVSGYSREELIGQTTKLFRSDYHPQSFYDDLWQTLRSGQSWSGDMTNRAKDGTLFWVQITISPIFDDNHQVVGYGSVKNDVTAQRHAMLELEDKEHQAQEILRSAIESIDCGIKIYDRDAHIVMANEKSHDMYPEAHDILERKGHAKEIVRRIFPDLSEQEIAQLHANNWSSERNAYRELSDGRHVSITRSPLADGGLITVHTDISDLMEQKERLQEKAANLDLMMALAVAANGSGDTDAAYSACLELICNYAGWEVGHAYFKNSDGSGEFLSGASWYLSDSDRFKAFCEVSDEVRFKSGDGILGRTLRSAQPVWVDDVVLDPDYFRVDAAKECGLAGCAAFPVVVRDEIVAILEFYSSRQIDASDDLTEIILHACTQVGRVAERERAEQDMVNRVNEELKRRDKELVEQNERFTAALENMRQGMCLFDKDKRLIVANRRYAELYGIEPDRLTPGVPLSEILKMRIDNGLFGAGSPEEYMNERINWVEAKTVDSKIQKLTDGRSIAITRQPMEGGGWLTTHEDITERLESGKQLKESRDFAAKAFNATPIAKAISEIEDGTLHDVNDAWCKMMGFRRDEALAQPRDPLDLWANPDERKRYVADLQRKGSVVGFEAKFRRRCGSEIDVMIYGERIEIGGEPKLLTVLQDVTDRKKAEEELRQSRKQFKAIVESMNVVPWEFDIESQCFTYVGPQALALSGYTVDQWTAPEFWPSFIHEDERESIAQTCEFLTLQCQDHDMEYRIVTPDGEVKWVRDVVTVIAEDHKPKSLRGVIFDISDRVKARAALQRSEQRFKDIVEISSDWIWECDSELRFEYISNRFTEITGIPSEELIGRTRLEFGNDPDVDWDKHQADMNERRTFRNFRYCVNRDGNVFHLDISGRPIFDRSGKFIGYRGTGFDRTAEELAEKELIKHRDHLQEMVNDATVQLKEHADELKRALAKEKELNEMQRQFLSMASHEFRTPLAIIDSSAQRLLKTTKNLDDKRVPRRIGKIRTAVSRMSQLMESTLSAARLEDGNAELKLEQVDFGDMIRSACEMHSELAGTHVISHDVDSEVGKITAEKSALEQILSNLLLNAVKYSPDADKIDVTARRVDDNIILTIQDYGVGIDEDEMPKMFQRYFRARTSSGIAGTGIGLNLVKTLIGLHGGSITVESEIGVGSIFEVTLPVAGPDPSESRDTKAA